MTAEMQNRWPLYALLGVGGALALSKAYTQQRRQRQLRSGEIRELRGQWWKVNGQLMHARVALDRVRTATLPLVLVHGLGVSGSYFVPAAQQLATEFDVYVPDLPGHGLSDTPGVQPDIPGLATGISRLDGFRRPR